MKNIGTAYEWVKTNESKYRGTPQTLASYSFFHDQT